MPLTDHVKLCFLRQVGARQPGDGCLAIPLTRTVAVVAEEPESDNAAKASWGGGFAVGIGIGVAFGVAMGNIGAGVAIGVAIGMGFAAAFTGAAKCRRPKPKDEGEAAG